MVNKKETNVKNKKRVRDFGEVFTPQWLVEEMLNLPCIKESCENIETTFLEPSAGEGAFLIAILKHKLETVSIFYNNDIQQYEQYSLYALSTLYGVELLQDNVEKCIVNLFETYLNYYNKACGKHSIEKENNYILNSANTILNKNIQQGDFLNKETFKNVKFDVIIGNPPYQLSVGGCNGANAIPIYDKFIEAAKRLNPKYITMIIPAKWYTGGRNLNAFRESMINDKRIREIHDFPKSIDCFPSVDIAGGICYFLWDSNHQGLCDFYEHRNHEVTSVSTRYLKVPYFKGVIRNNNAISITDKLNLTETENFSKLVKSQTPFGLYSNFKNFSNSPASNYVKLLRVKKKGDGDAYVSINEITKNKEIVNQYKIYTNLNYGRCIDGNPPYKVISDPILGFPQTCCTQSYLVIGGFETQIEAENVISYMETKFFRFLVMLALAGQTFSPSTYSLIPMQNFSKAWTDDELYEKYGLSQDEIDYIESMIRPMEK